MRTNATPGGARRLAVAACMGLVLLTAGNAEALDLRERLREFGANVMQKIRKLRGLEPAPKPPAPPPVVEQPVEQPPAPPSPERPASPETSAPPAPAREPGIAVRSQCQSKDDTRYAETVDLEVEDGRVHRMDARIDIPKRGSCRFELSDFRQTRERPHIELVSKAGDACAVRLWQQGGKLVMAISDCPDKCARPGAFDYVWPIELDAASGGCL